MRKSLMLLFSLIMLFIASCNAAPTATPQPSVTPSLPKIALVMKTLTNPFFIEMEKGARQAEKDLGIELIVRTAAQETSIEQQIEIINELTKQKVDAIVIAPGDSLELIPSLKAAQDVGIVIINIDNHLNPEFAEKTGLKNVPFISVDNENGAYLAVKSVAEKITTPTKAVIIEGIRSALNAEARKNGAIRAFKENSNIEVVGMETAEWKIDSALEVTHNLLEANPDVKIIFCANDMMALGAIQYLEQAKLTDVTVIGFDALEEAKAAIKAGKLAVTVDQQAAKQGYIGVEYAVKALKGEKLPAETMVDVFVINAENLK
jgi:ribose transport system substrate-binding protein